MVDSLASTPPMGWNSFDSYNASVTEAEVKANADIMARRLAPFGWEYVVVDFCWSHPTPPLESSPGLEELPGGKVAPLLRMDPLSRLVPAPNRFPSSANGQGFKLLSQAIHELGLKFGIHIMRGIPRQAVQQNLPITSGLLARDIARPESTCPWLNHMYGVDMSKPGAQGYYNSLFELYASWGVDYVKVDDMSYPYHADEIEAVYRGMESCGRPMIISLSPGPAPLESVEHLRQYAHLWRISPDFWDDWEQLKRLFSLCADWTAWITPGHWPDADMLPLGRLSVRGPQAQSRWSNFTQIEQFTLMSLFTIFRSPLMIGSDLTAADEFTISLLTNPEVLSVNQHSQNTRLLFYDNQTAGWVADVPGNAGSYVALFNLGESERLVAVLISELGPYDNCHVRDLWQRKDMPGMVSESLVPSLPAHGAALYQVMPVNQC